MGSPEIRIGCSGYVYKDWRGRFYPEGLPQRKWFGYYADHFDTLEVNNTFYRLPEASTFDDWRERAPAGFLYAVKMSRWGTHRKKLRDPEEWVATFLGRAERLGSRMGPILVQLPPRWKANVERLRRFLEVAPERHRWAVEVRDPDWLRRPVYEVLAEHGAALVWHDLIPDHPRRLTADWVYLRFHGPLAGRPYTGSYSPQALTGAARRIERHLEEGRDVYAYFNNDVAGNAVRNALALRRYLGLP